MPLFDYRCPHCQALTEVLVRGTAPASVPCATCGSPDTHRALSTFTVRATSQPKYTEDFREAALPFLKTQAREAFAGGGESEEAKAFKLTEQIGRRVDAALEQKVFRNLPD